MKQIGLLLWNNAMLCSTILASLGTIPDMPGPGWVYGVAGIVGAAVASTQTKGAVTVKNES